MTSCVTSHAWCARISVVSIRARRLANAPPAEWLPPNDQHILQASCRGGGGAWRPEVNGVSACPRFHGLLISDSIADPLPPLQAIASPDYCTQKGTKKEGESKSRATTRCVPCETRFRSTLTIISTLQRRRDISGENHAHRAHQCDD